MLFDPALTPDIILLESSGMASAHWLVKAIDIKRRVISGIQRDRTLGRAQKIKMEPRSDSHGPGRTTLEHRDDPSTTSLLELVPSLEHSIVGILNHNGELNDDSGRLSC